METYKPILDACCGGKMFYFDKNDPAFCFKTYAVRKQLGRTFTVKPDVVGDFTSMDFPDNTFSMVVFDRHTCVGGERTPKRSRQVSNKPSMAHSELIGKTPWPRASLNVFAFCVPAVSSSSNGTSMT